MNRDQILATLRERILAFATSRVSRDHAEDLTQDTMAVLHEKYPLVSELTELIPLAFQVLKYKMLDAHRKALRHGEYNQASIEGLPLADTGDDPVTQLDQKQRVDRLLGSLGQLQESVTTDEAPGFHERTTYVVTQDLSAQELLVRIPIGKP